jgi:chromosome segregation ATPase
MSERDDLSAGLQIPDLDLAPAVSKRQPSTAQIGTSSEKSFGGDDDFELLPTGGARLELSGGAVATAAHEPPAQRGPWPSGRTKPADQLAIDPLEVALVAGYGPTPTNALLAPSYAYRVYARRRALEQAISEQHAALQQAEAERDSALAQLTTELRPLLENNDSFRRALDPVRELERLAGDRNAALSQADAGYRQQLASFDQELTRLSEAATQAQAVVTRCSGAAEATESALRRAEAKHQRVQIEIRGVMDVARRALGPAGGDIPAPQATQLAELHTRLQSLEPELAQARGAHAGSTAALESARRELQGLEARTHQVQRQRASAGGGMEQQLSARAAGVTDAERQRREALADVARALLDARGSVAVPEATVQSLVALDARVEAQAVRLETHLRALDSQDHERVRQGVILALSGLGVVVLAIALKAML